jgi:hypothetical protein
LAIDHNNLHVDSLVVSTDFRLRVGGDRSPLPLPLLPLVPVCRATSITGWRRGPSAGRVIVGKVVTRGREGIARGTVVFTWGTKTITIARVTFVWIITWSGVRISHVGRRITVKMVPLSVAVRQITHRG